MTSKASLILCILLIINVLEANCQQVFSTNEVHEDMLVLRKKLENYHPGMYAFVSKEKYNRLFDSLYSSVTQPMTYMQAFHQITPLVIAVQDGHTAVSHTTKFIGKKPKLVPLYIRKIQNRYFIAYNCSNDSTLLRGTEIFSIDKMPISNIFEKIKTFVSVDNNNELSKIFYAQNDFPSYFLKYFGVRDSIKIAYHLAKDDSVYIKKIACLDGKQVGSALNKRYKWAIRQNLSLKIADSLTHTAVLDITSFLMSGKLDLRNHKFKRTLRENFKTIKEKGVENLILDLRGNGGGFIPNVSRLLKYIMPEKFTLIDTLEFKKKAYFKVAPIPMIFPPMVLWTIFRHRHNDMLYRTNSKVDNNDLETELHFDGNVYFLINQGCYSATTFTLALAKDRGVGTFIGEQAGGAMWGSHAVNWYEYNLPHTNIKIHSPLFRLKHKLKNPIESFFLQPDFTVGRNYQELLKNNDNVLDFTLQMIRAKRDKY